MGFLILAIFLHQKFHLKIYKSKKVMAATVLAAFITGILWDYYATWRHHWIFPGNGLIGIRILGLPIEEFLFFLIMPYWGLTIFRLIEAKL